MGKIFKPYVAAGLGHNPVASISGYEIADGQLIVHRRWGKTPTKIDLDGATAVPSQSFIKGALKIGDVTIKRTGVEYVCKNVPNVDEFCRLFEEGKKPKGPEKTPPTRFGPRMVLIPRLPWEFASPMYTKNFDTDIVHTGIFVTRGTPLVKFNNPTSISSAMRSKANTNFAILSPVAGLVIIGGLNIDEYEENKKFCMSILISDEEPLPESGEFMFGSYCDTILKSRSYLFRWRYQVEKEDEKYNSSNIENITRKLRARSAKVIDILDDPYEMAVQLWGKNQNGGYHISESIEWIRAHKPEWNSALSHLNFESTSQIDARRSVSEPKALNAPDTNTAKNSSRNREVTEFDLKDKEDLQSWTERHESAIKNFDLSLPFKESELIKAYNHRIRNSGSFDPASVNRDYKLLRPFAM
jgi:hypothetical protein